jgi:hydrogenase maturation protease
VTSSAAGGPAGRSADRLAVVVGIGNPARGDDGVGPQVAARIAALDLPGVRVVVRGDPLGLLDELDGDQVVVVDAVRGAGPPGAVQVRVVGRRGLPRPSTGPPGTHGLGVAEVVELARALDRLPRRLVLVGVEAGSFAHDRPLTGVVRDGVERAVRAVLDCLDRDPPPGRR